MGVTYLPNFHSHSHCCWIADILDALPEIKCSCVLAQVPHLPVMQKRARVVKRCQESLPQRSEVNKRVAFYCTVPLKGNLTVTRDSRHDIFEHCVLCLESRVESVMSL